MDRRGREEERARLTRAIADWNASRLDIFAITPPDQNLEFHGVMRFFYQDDEEKISTKCIRVSSTATTRDVIDTLIDKFHPDMRMLTRPAQSLYEVHSDSDEERMLELNELPLRVQLNWTKDLREGRFLLRNAAAKSKPNFYKTDGDVPVGNFKRKLSKREKKEQKKKEKEAKLKGVTLDDSSQPKLYDNLSKTFTRTISNPEGVLRRKRQQKVEQMERYRSRPEAGGVLKVYAHTVFPEANYKTLLVPFNTPASHIVKQSLQDFGHPKEKPDDYCLVRVILPAGADPNDYVKEKGWNQEAIMDEDEFPLEYLRTKRPEGKGNIMFELKKRPPDYKPRPKKRKNTNQERLPYFLELHLDGTDIIDYKPVRHQLLLNVTEVGSQRDPRTKAPFLELRSPGILPRHCVIANMEGVVTLTPSCQDALVTVDDQQLHQTMVLQHGNVVRFANTYTYRFCDPKVEDPGWEERQRSLSQSDPHSMETTFDAVENIETRSSLPLDPMPAPRAPPVKQHILPATLEFREPSEDAFLKALIGEVNGAHVHFKLAPTYALYLACRHRLSKAFRPNMDATERAQRLTPFINKIADMVDTTVRENYQIAMAMTFWLANGSEFHHFLQKDLDMSVISQDAQDILFQSTQDAFRHLVRRIRFELNVTLGTFFDPSGEADIEKDFEEDEQMKAKDSERWMSPPTRNQRRGKLTVGEVLHILSSVMTLLRRCRVNAALTIQLFSQIFHFVNVFLFNRFFAPPPHTKLCTKIWGERLQRRIERVFEWAEKQGLELAANAHLSKVHQAVKLFAMEKTSRVTLEAACSQASRLNSRQLGTLLEMYQPGQGEKQIPREIISEMVAIHRKANDEADVNIGRPLVREEDPELRIPIIIAEDGYSSDIVKDIPNGLPEFLDPLVRSGMVRFSVNAMAIGTWTIYMHSRPPTPEPVPESPVEPRSPPPAMNSETGKPLPQVKADARPPPEKTEPDVVIIDLDKGSSPSMGLSIVALKAPTQEKMGIYIKAVVPGGAGAKDGRIKAGDQILEVDGHNIVGLDRDEATKFLVKSGSVVALTIAVQGAIFHGLAGILSQPSPPVRRANLGQQPPPPSQTKNQMPVPQPRNRGDVDRRSPTSSDSSHGSRNVERHDWRESSTMPRNIPGMTGLSQADKAKSSPNLVADERAATLPSNQRYSHFEPPLSRERVSSVSNSRPAERSRVLQKGGLAQRSKSTSELDPDNFDSDDGFPRHSQSSSNLHEPLYKGKAPAEEPPFRGPHGKVFVDQLEHEPSRRLPQPREEPRPVPQPRGRPNGPQNGGPHGQYDPSFNESQNHGPPRQFNQSPNGLQQRMPPQGYRPSGPLNQTSRDNGSAGQPQLMNPRLGHPRVNGPPGQPRMNGPPGHMRMNGPHNGPPGQQQRFLGPMYQGRMAGPTQQGPQRFVSPSIPYDQPKSPNVIETHFPAEPPRNEDKRSVEPSVKQYNQSPQPGPQRPGPQDQGPRMRLPPSGQATNHNQPQQDNMPPPHPQAVNYDVPFTDLPPPPADLTSPLNDSTSIPDDLPLPPPPSDIPGWDDELDDYQKMFEEQQRQLDEEMKLLQAADDELSNADSDKVPPPQVERPAYASLPRQGRINQPSTPLGDQQRPQLQRQPSSNGPIPVPIPKAPTSDINRQQSTGFDTQNLNNRAAPMSVTNLMPSAAVNTSISPSAWDRDEKEKKEEWYEGEMLRMKTMEINDLVRIPNKSKEQEERLRKLQVEVEFQKRVQEAQDSDGDSNEEENITRATVKARMVDMVADNTHNSLGNMLTKPPPARGQENNHSDYVDNQARRLQQLQDERMRQQQEERIQQQQQQDGRIQQQQQERIQQQQQERIHQQQQERIQQQQQERIQQQQQERIQQQQQERMRQQQEEKIRQQQQERMQQQQQHEERIRQQQAERMRQQQGYEGAQRQQQEEETLRRQEEELQRRYEEQRLEYDRREAQIEQERIRLEQQLNLRNGPSQNINTSPYPPGSNEYTPQRPLAATTQAHNNYNGHYQARPVQSSALTNQPIKKIPPPVSSKPAIGPKPFVAPKPNLKVQIPNHTPSYDGQTAPSNNNYAPLNSHQDNSQTLATPENSQNLNVYRTGTTPGVIGGQEVYKDPYERKIMNQRMKKEEIPNSSAQPLTFRDKLKAFSEDGVTPEKKVRVSKWEQKFLEENPDAMEG